MAIRAKYGNRKTTIDGLTFHSRREAERYCELKLMQAAGMIRDLELQPKYDLVVNGQKVCRYTADFRYWDVERTAQVVEDVKGYRTRDYILKKALMFAVHGIDVVEVR
jgi:hypothetical protein